MGYSQGAPGRLYDWRIKAVRDYWTNEVIAPYVNCENISGIFMDDTTDVARPEPLWRLGLCRAHS